MVKNLSTMEETQVPSVGQEDPLEKGMVTHSSILAWIENVPAVQEIGFDPWIRKIPWRREWHPWYL